MPRGEGSKGFPSQRVSLYQAPGAAQPRASRLRPVVYGQISNPHLPGRRRGGGKEPSNGSTMHGTTKKEHGNQSVPERNIMVTGNHTHQQQQQGNSQAGGEA